MPGRPILNITKLAYLASLLCCVPAFSQIDASFSPSPVGSGARAAGMADAFVALADDATAVSWNPAGLVQLERPEIAIVGSFNFIEEHFRAPGHPEFNTTNRSENAELNFASVSLPLPPLFGQRNATISFAYQQQYDFSREFASIYDSSSDITQSTQTVRLNQEGKLGALTSAIGVELSDRLSIGLAVNFWHSTPFSTNSWSQESHFFEHAENKFGEQDTTVDARTEYEDFEGTNFAIGALLRLTEHFQVGLRFDTEFTGKAEYTRTEDREVVGGFRGAPTIDEESREVWFPSTLAIGGAYRPGDKLTVAFDVSFTDYDDFYVETAEGEKISLVDNRNLNSPGATNFQTAVTVRLGAEYVFVPEHPSEELDRLWSLRGGLFFDQEPASGSPNLITPGDGKPDDFYGIALGLGLLVKNRINIDLAYQFRYGNDVNGDLLLGIPGFNEDVYQHRVLLSTVVHF